MASCSRDVQSHTLVFNIQRASFPNWEGEQQRRTYELNGDELSYRVVARPNRRLDLTLVRELIHDADIDVP